MLLLAAHTCGPAACFLLSLRDPCSLHDACFRLFMRRVQASSVEQRHQATRRRQQQPHASGNGGRRAGPTAPHQQAHHTITNPASMSTPSRPSPSPIRLLPAAVDRPNAVRIEKNQTASSSRLPPAGGGAATVYNGAPPR